MDRALLDTDIFSEILKGIDQKVIARAAAYRAAFGHYTLSVITVMEMVKGFHKLQREDRIHGGVGQVKESKGNARFQ